MLEAQSQQLRSSWLNSGVGRWYMGREPNDRLIIRLLSMVVCILLLWSLVWKPVSDWRELANNRFENAQSTLDWVHANEARVRAAVRAQAPGTGTGPSLLPVITRAAEAQGLSLNRLQPESNGAVTVLLQAQPFNEVMKWVHNLQENNGVTILRI
ncbi:MAG: type II secretion system protein M, partial [Gammaproteobacteria bacterium]|nr:type II secretion system protein M [Gammaproteobacteria bacterium]